MKAGRGLLGGPGLLAPQRVSETGQSQSDRKGDEPVEGVGEDGNQERGDGADGQQQGGPAREDPGSVQNEPEQQTAEQVADRSDQAGQLQGPDVADDGTAGEGGEEVLDVLGRLVGQLEAARTPRRR